MQNRTELAKLAETLSGIPVWGTLPGSLSHRAGVRYGDVVLSINGKPTANIDDYLEARNLRSDGAEFVIFRDGAQLTLQLEFDSDRSRPGLQDLERLSAQLVEGRLLPSDRPPSEPTGERH